MKKIVLILGSLISLIILAALILPIFFKDDIRRAIDKELSNNLNAQVFYDSDEFNLSLFRDFPNLSIQIGDFGIAGTDQFKDDTLLSVSSFQISVDLMSALTGEKIQIQKILLDEPEILVMVLKDGTANYDIMREDGSGEKVVEKKEVAVEEESVPIRVAIKEWAIQNARVIYYDQSLDFYISLDGLDHKGSGDFTLDNFDINTLTTIQNLSLGYEGSEYISNKSLIGNIVMNMDLNSMNFTFKENEIKLNDFGFSFDGNVSMPDEDINVDLTFLGNNIDLLSILSLIPGDYSEYLEDINATGKVGFDGFVKGTYNDEDMPRIYANIKVENGTLAYEGYPLPMEQINIFTYFDFPSLDLRETSFVIEQFSMMLDGEPMKASLIFKDLEDYYWNFNLDGTIDLEKMTKVFPLEGMELLGNIKAKMNTEGRYSDLEAERYQTLTTSGSFEVTSFKYTDADFPQGFNIEKAIAEFDPQKISLNEFKASTGSTDIDLSGRLSNYLQFILEEESTLVGVLNHYSSNVNIDELMPETESEESDTETIEEDTIEASYIRIPSNIDFTMISRIDKITYDGNDLNDFEGRVKVNNGNMYLENTEFNLLNGGFALAGDFRTAPEVPDFNMNFQISELSIPAAYKAFNTIRKLAPMAEKMSGTFSTNLNMAGTLAPDFTPYMDDLSGGGVIEIKDGAIQDVKILGLISNFTRLNADDGAVSMEDVAIGLEIEDGRVFIEPFDVVLGGYTTTISGSNSIEGELDYVFTLQDVETGVVGQAVSSILSRLTGDEPSEDLTTIDINLGVTGTFTDPNVGLLSTQSTSDDEQEKKKRKSSTADVVKEKASEEIEAKKEELKDTIQSVIDEKKEAVTKEVKEKAKDEAKDAIKNLLKKKKKGN